MQTKLSTSYFMFYNKFASWSISCAVKMFVAEVLAVKMVWQDVYDKNA